MNRKAAPAAIPLLLLLLLQAGCISFHPPPPGGTGGGLRPAPASTPVILPPDANTPKAPLSDALAALPAAELEGDIDTRGLSLVKVWGYGVDSSGLARTWVLGMQGGGKTFLLTYTDGEYQVQDLPVSLPEEEVKIGELITPQDLFRRNLNTIVMEMNNKRAGECDLTLDATSYQVVIHSASESSTLSFDAKKEEFAGSLPPGTMEGSPPVTGLQTPAVPTPATGTPSPATPGRLGLPVLVPLGAAALAVLGFRRRG